MTYFIGSTRQPGEKKKKVHPRAGLLCTTCKAVRAPPTDRCIVVILSLCAFLIVHNNRRRSTSTLPCSSTREMPRVFCPLSPCYGYVMIAPSFSDEQPTVSRTKQSFSCSQIRRFSCWFSCQSRLCTVVSCVLAISFFPSEHRNQRRGMTAVGALDCCLLSRSSSQYFQHTTRVAVNVLLTAFFATVMPHL